VRVVAAELGLAKATVYWWKAHDLVDRGIKPGLSTSERGELAAARRRIQELETQAVHLDRDALANGWRRDAGDLDRQQVGRAVAHGQELDEVQGLAVLIRLGPAGLDVDHRLGC
jgi:hypothetical protein